MTKRDENENARTSEERGGNEDNLTPEERDEADVAPEEEELEGWLPEAEPTDGPAPAP